VVVVEGNAGNKLQLTGIVTNYLGIFFLHSKDKREKSVDTTFMLQFSL